MARASVSPVVHVELHTGNLPRACFFYTRLFGWRAETIRAGCGSYLGLDMGEGVKGGVVECESERALWLPYVEVPAIEPYTERARAMGATVSLEPREGPGGWRSVVATEAGAAVALWQPKR